MVTYHFDPAIVLGVNVLEMRNTQNNGNGNFGTVGVRNYLLTDTTLSDPCVIANLNYSGGSGSSFTFNFNYTQCCPEVSYNCVDGTCVDPGDGTGIYGTLVACEAACSTPPAVSYNCVSGNCVDPGDGTGTYSTLVACEAVCGAPTTASLAWSYSETGGSVGIMDLYVNGSIVESRSATSSGTWTVSVGDTINVEVSSSSCSGGNGKANAYCTGIIEDAACADGATSLFTSVYTVLSGDLGTTLHLDTFSHCDTGCV